MNSFEKTDKNKKKLPFNKKDVIFLVILAVFPLLYEILTYIIDYLTSAISANIVSQYSNAAFTFSSSVTHLFCFILYVILIAIGSIIYKNLKMGLAGVCINLLAILFSTTVASFFKAALASVFLFINNIDAYSIITSIIGFVSNIFIPVFNIVFFVLFKFLQKRENEKSKSVVKRTVSCSLMLAVIPAKNILVSLFVFGGLNVLIYDLIRDVTESYAFFQYVFVSSFTSLISEIISIVVLAIIIIISVFVLKNISSVFAAYGSFSVFTSLFSAISNLIYGIILMVTKSEFLSWYENVSIIIVQILSLIAGLAFFISAEIIQEKRIKKEAEKAASEESPVDFGNSYYSPYNSIYESNNA